MKIKRIFAVLISAALLFSASSCMDSEEETGIKEIVRGYSIHTFYTSTMGRILYSANGVDAVCDAGVLGGFIYKYTFDKDEKYIFAHCMITQEDWDSFEEPENEFFPGAVGVQETSYVRTINHQKYKIKYDGFFAIKCDGNYENPNTQFFSTEDELLRFCEKENLSLNNWIYNLIPFCESYVIRTDGDYTLKWLWYGHNAIEYKGKEIINGCISDYRVADGKITFNLKMPDLGYDPEYPEQVNQNLSPQSDKPLGKMKIDNLFGKTEYFYDKNISIDVLTGDIREVN